MKKYKQKKSFRNRLINLGLAGFGALVMTFYPTPNVSAKEVQKELKKPSYTTEEVRDFIYSEDLLITTAGDGVFGKTFLNKLELKPDSKIDLNNIFYTLGKDKDKEKDLNFGVIDSQQGIQNIRDYIKSKGKLTGKEKAFVNHLNFLEKYASENPSDPETIKKLNKALEDGVIDTQADLLYNLDKNEWDIKKGTYVLIAKNPEKSETVPVLINLDTHGDKAILEKKGIESTLYGDNLRNLEDYGTASTFVEHDIKPEKLEKETKEKKNLEGIVQVKAGDFYGVGAGLKYGPLAGIVNVYGASDETTKDIETEPSSRTGRYFSGTEEEIDWKGIGFDVEYHPQNFLKGAYIGAGLTHWDYTVKTEESIHASDGSILAENSDSSKESDTSSHGYVGYSHPLTDRLNIRGQVGYSTGAGEGDIGKGLFGGLGLSYEFGKNKK